MAAREIYEEIGSTQDRALELARSGAPAGTVVRAVRQTHGRGRLDHRWESPPGGLWLSVVVPATGAPETWLSLAVGARLLQALQHWGSIPLRLKWPNDLVAIGPDGRARKLSGILIDRVGSPSLGTAAVAGIGVNVRVDPADLPPELRERVVSLHRLVPSPPTPDEVEPRVVAAALEAARDLDSVPTARQVMAMCRASLFGVGRAARVDGTPRGTITGLDDDGALLLADGPNLVPIRSGDVDVDGLA